MEFPIQPLAQTAKLDLQISNFRLTRHTFRSDNGVNNALDRDFQEAPDPKQIGARSCVFEKPQR